jgi:hypothetical protein
MTDLFGAPTFRDFIAQGKDVKFQYESLDGTQRSAHKDRVVLRYSFGDPKPGSSPRQLIITVKREVHEDHIDWLIESAGGPGGPGT